MFGVMLGASLWVLIFKACGWFITEWSWLQASTPLLLCMGLAYLMTKEQDMKDKARNCCDACGKNDRYLNFTRSGKFICNSCPSIIHEYHYLGIDDNNYYTAPFNERIDIAKHDKLNELQYNERRLYVGYCARVRTTKEIVDHNIRDVAEVAIDLMTRRLDTEKETRHITSIWHGQMRRP
jgi:hypothetical protein